MGIILQDSFNRADGAIGTADSGHTWLHTGARQAAVSGNVAIGGTGGNQEDVSYVDAGVADFELTAKLLCSEQTDVRCGVVWRLSDGDNYYNIGMAYAGYNVKNKIHKYYLYCAKREAGSLLLYPYLGSQIIDWTSSSPGEWIECRIVTQGTSIKVYLPHLTLTEDPVYDLTSEFNSTATGVGLLLDAASEKIDDFLVTGASPPPSAERRAKGGIWVPSHGGKLLRPMRRF